MKKIRPVDILLLQSAVVIYSLSTVAANFASKYDFLSPKYILFLGLDFLFLAAYAVLWQQLIKKFQLSIAYANKAMTLMWSMLWNWIIFSRGITAGRVIGVVLVTAGVIVMNFGGSAGADTEAGAGSGEDESND